MRAPESVNLFATGANGDEDLGEDITMKGDKFHYVQKPNMLQLEGEGEGGDLSFPDKVLTLDPKIGVHHTSFFVQLEGDGDKHETEKTHALEPIATRAYVNDPGNALTYPTQRTAFYV